MEHHYSWVFSFFLGFKLGSCEENLVNRAEKMFSLGVCLL